MNKKETITPASPATGNSPASALPRGTAAKIPIIPGYGQGPKVGEVMVIILDVVRGNEATTRTRELGMPSGGPLKTGFEDVIVRVKAEYIRSGRGPREQPFKLTEGQFLASSPDGWTEYKVSSLSKRPEEGLIGRIFASGDSHEGWLIFQVPKEEKRPLLIFRRENVENVWGLWSDIYFQLF